MFQMIKFPFPLKLKALAVNKLKTVKKHDILFLKSVNFDYKNVQALLAGQPSYFSEIL